MWRRRSTARKNDAVRQRSDTPRSRQWVGLALATPPVLLAFALIALPAVHAALSTLQSSSAQGSEVSLANYVRFFSDQEAIDNLVFTLWVTSVTTFLLLAFCLPLSIYLRFASGWVATAIQGLAIFPLFVPAIVVCYALIRFMGPHGVIASLLAHLGFPNYSSPYLTEWGPVVGLFWEGMPLTVLILISGLGQVPKSAIEAARDVGAGAPATLFAIIIPLIRRSLLVAFALNFLSIMGAFTTPYLLGPASPEMIGPFMQRTFQEVRDPEQAETQAVVSFLICAVVGVIYVRGIAARKGRIA
jgi:putative spermidine/putrescine transport system permease protein